MLHNVYCYLVADVSGKTVGPVLNLSVLNSMICPKTLVTNNRNTLHSISEERRSYELDFLCFYWKNSHCVCVCAVAYPGILFGGGGGVQQIQLRTEGRENRELGAVAP
jgi:hypothetical protein